MSNSYYIDLKTYPLARYRDILKSMEMIPSRKILHEDIDRRFDLLMREGIDNLQRLSEQLKNPKSIHILAATTGIPQEFLEILKRELSGLRRPPSPLKDFPGIDPAVITKLESAGLKNTMQFFEAAQTRDGRMKIAEQCGIDYPVILELAKLSGLSRLYGVGPVFARMLFDSGTDTVSKIADADPHALYEKLMKMNDEKEYTRIKFREKDMVYCKLFARNFPKTDAYDE